MITQPQFHAPDFDKFEQFKEKPFTGHTRQVGCIAWNPLGTKLASSDVTLRIWNYEDSRGLEKPKDYKNNQSTIECLEWSDNNTLLGVSRDAFKIWDIRDSKPGRFDRNQKKSRVDFTKATWAHDQIHFALANKENHILFFDKRTQAPLQTLKITFDIQDFLWDMTDAGFLVVGDSGNLYIHENAKSHTLVESVPCHATRITCMTLDSSNKYVATGGQDAMVQLLSLQDLIQLKYFSRTQGAISKLSFSYASRFLAVSCDEPYVDVYNVENGTHSYRVKCMNPQSFVRWHPKKLVLAMIDQDDKKRQNISGSSQDENAVRLWAA